MRGKLFFNLLADIWVYRFFHLRLPCFLWLPCCNLIGPGWPSGVLHMVREPARMAPIARSKSIPRLSSAGSLPSPELFIWRTQRRNPFLLRLFPGEAGVGIGGVSKGLAVVSFPWWEMGLEQVKSLPAGSWLAVGNARKKKQQTRRGKKNQHKPTLRKYGGRGKKKKKKKNKPGGSRETRRRGKQNKDGGKWEEKRGKVKRGNRGVKG